MNPISYIQPSEIEKELETLWKTHQNNAVLRASLFNLILYTKKDLREDYIQKIMQNLIRRFPCRIITITESQSEGEDFLRVHLSDPTADQIGNKIFCDIIHFEVSHGFRERIPFVILPHLQPNLPVYLLWGDDPYKKDPIALQLETMATRTIFDSESSECLISFATTLLQLSQSSAYDIADLNWARFASWRGLLTNMCNNPHKLDALMHSKEVVISYNTSANKNFSHNKIQASYLQSWIAVMLKWKFITASGNKEELSFQYEHAYGKVNILLTPIKMDLLLPGRVVQLDIISHANDRMTFVRDPNQPHLVRTQHSTPLYCEMPLYQLFDKEQSGRSLIQEIYSQGTSKTFLEVLALIKTFNMDSICT